MTPKAQHIIEKLAEMAPVERQLFKHYQEGGPKPSMKKYIEEGREMGMAQAKKGRIAGPAILGTLGALTGAMFASSAPGYQNALKPMLKGVAAGGAVGAGLGALVHHRDYKRRTEYVNSPMFEAREASRFQRANKQLKEIYKKK